MTSNYHHVVPRRTKFRKFKKWETRLRKYKGPQVFVRSSGAHPVPRWFQCGGNSNELRNWYYDSLVLGAVWRFKGNAEAMNNWLREHAEMVL